MKKAQVKPHRQRQYPEAQREPLLVSDLARFLSGLAKLQEDDKAGNRELGEGLQELVRALRPYAGCPVMELTEAMKGASASPEDSQYGLRITKPVFSPEFDAALESIGWNDVESFLENADPTKRQIAELGFRRFGISRSSLERLNKQDALESVRAALENERTLDVISREAVRAGQARSG